MKFKIKKTSNIIALITLLITTSPIIAKTYTQINNILSIKSSKLLNLQKPTYILGLDDEGEGCDGGPVGCLCVSGGDYKHTQLNSEYTGCITNGGMQMESELQCVMASRGCPSCMPDRKPYVLNSVKSCQDEAHARGYKDYDIYVANIEDLN